jgi:hypothetical protein
MCSLVLATIVIYGLIPPAQAPPAHPGPHRVPRKGSRTDSRSRTQAGPIVIEATRRRSLMVVPTNNRSAPGDGKVTASAAELSLARLHALRIGYLVLGGGLAMVKWPLFFHRDMPWTLTEGVVNCLLAALSLLALLGLRYPVQMLPVLLFECLWKVIWLSVVALPLWASHRVDPATRQTTYSVLVVVIIFAVIPWRYVYSQYVTRRGDRWRSDPSPLVEPGSSPRVESHL